MRHTPVYKTSWPSLDLCVLAFLLGMFVAALFVVPGLLLLYGLCSLTACLLLLAVCLLAGRDE